ncbi:MAG: dienelactone hydrolase family protein [Mycobacteriales bacterium]
MGDLDLTESSEANAGSKRLHGYLATPGGEGPWPGLVMVHEIFGLDAMVHSHADRLARAGYLTLAVDLFSAGGARRCLVSTMRSMTAGRGRAFTDIETARQWLRASPKCTGKVGVIGFCMGGGFALLAANRGFDAASPNYGQLPRDIENALAGACPVVASYGGRDRSLKNAAAKLEKTLTDLGIAHDVKEYPRAGHAFLNEAETGPRPLRPLLRVAGIGPDPEAAADAWQRIEAFFAQHLR